jgi:hypothetical protein
VNIIFYQGPEDIFGKAIRLWTWSRYSHCEIEFSPAPCEGRGIRCSALAGPGVHWRKPLMLGQLPYWDSVSIPLSEEDERRGLEWATRQIGDRYDWPGIFFSEVLPLNRRADSRWFCSELCCEFLNVVGYLPGIYPAISPERLYRLIMRSS